MSGSHRAPSVIRAGKMVTTRKDHWCVNCYQTIPKGSRAYMPPELPFVPSDYICDPCTPDKIKAMWL